jgi:hypothetical protein
MEEFLNVDNVEMRGSKRAELLFAKLNVAHSLYRNIKNIYAVDANEGDKYVDWLLHEKMPKLKDDLEDALVKEYLNADKPEEFWQHVQTLQDNFAKYNELVRKEATELEFLRAYQ